VRLKGLDLLAHDEHAVTEDAVEGGGEVRMERLILGDDVE
jgi:hypothetical protein